MRLVRVLILILCATPMLRAQSARPTSADYRTEIQSTIAKFENGDERYRDHDGFRRVVDAIAARNLGLTRQEFASMRTVRIGIRSQLHALNTSNVSDISPDTSDEDEASVAISRTNPNLIVAGANDLYAMYDSSMPAFVSQDGGKTWNTYYLPFVPGDGVQAFGDPMIICDDKGTFYYAFLTSDVNAQGGSSYISDLQVAHSSDGIHWTLGGPVIKRTTPSTVDEDKETIAVDRDPSSPYHGRVYIFWSRYQSGYTDRRMISYSDNQGMTWSTPKTISTRFGYFAMIRVGKGGTVFVGSSFRDIPADTGVHGVLVSRDGGKTFKDNFIASYYNYPGNNYVNGLKGNTGPKAYPYFHFDVDPSNNTLYAVYGNYNTEGSYAEQYATTSTDEGQSWSDPVQIGDPNRISTDHFQPWVTVDPTNHKARVSMYSSEEDLTENIMSRMVSYDISSVSGGAIPSSKKLGESLFDPRRILNPWGGAFIGDYTGGDAYNGVYAAVWTEQDDMGGGDIMAYVENGTSSVNAPIDRRSLAISDVYPNPASTSVSVVLTGGVEAGHLHVYDLRGREVLSLPFTGSGVQLLDVSRLSAGVYNVTAETPHGTASKQFIVLH